MEEMSDGQVDLGKVRPKLIWRALFPALTACFLLIASFAEDKLAWLGLAIACAVISYVAHVFVVIVDREQQTLTTRRTPLHH
jgi:hypothetical protein